MEVHHCSDKENLAPPQHWHDESGIYEQLSIITENPGPSHMSLPRRAHHSGKSNCIYESVTPQLTTFGSTQSLHNPGSVYGAHPGSVLSVCPQYTHGQQQGLQNSSTAPQYRHPQQYVAPNGVLYSAVQNVQQPLMPTRNGYVHLQFPSKSVTRHSDPKNNLELKEQWVDFGPPQRPPVTGGEGMEPFSQCTNTKSTSNQRVLQNSNVLNTQHSKDTKAESHGTRTKVQIHQQSQPGGRNTLHGGLLPMKTPLPAIEEDFYDCYESETGEKARSHRSSRSRYGASSPDDGSTDFLSLSNSDSLERVTPLPDINNSFEVFYDFFLLCETSNNRQWIFSMICHIHIFEITMNLL